MPLRDWQFWIVSVVALAALWLVLRQVLPRRRARRRSRRVKLTVGGEQRRSAS